MSHTLPMIRHRCKMWALAQSLGDVHRSLVTLERILSEYNEDLIFLLPHQLHAFCLRFLVNFSHTHVIGSYDYNRALFSVNQQIRVVQSSGHLSIC